MVVAEQSKRELVRQHILGELHSGKYAVGDRFISENQLASATGICKNTVREAVSSLVSDGVLVRRQGSGTFVAGTNAPPPAATRRRVIGVYSYDPIDAVLESKLIVHGVHCAALETGFDVLHFGGDCAQNIAELERNPGMELAGVVFTHIVGADPARLGRDFPNLRFVVANYQTGDFDHMPENVSGVFAEEFSGGYMMTNHLLQKGCRRIAVHSAPHPANDTNYQQRIAGYRYALEEHGIAFDPELIHEQDSTAQAAAKRQAGALAIERMLAAGPLDAFFGLNDFFTAGACDYLREHRPELKIVMAGYDNYDSELSRYYNFSTVAVDLDRIGRQAVQFFATPAPPTKRIMVPPRLIAR